MRAVILVENTAPPGLEREHGLSVCLEHRGRKVLLDAGHSGKFARNAEKLGVDLSRVDTAVLSHGHYDHADGLDVFFALAPNVPVRARPAVLAPQYHGERYIGLKGELLERYRDRFLLADGPTDLGDGLYLVPDGVDHEQSLVVDTDQGLAVFNSCSHAGAGPIAKDILPFLLPQSYHIRQDAATPILGSPFYENSMFPHSPTCDRMQNTERQNKIHRRQ